MNDMHKVAIIEEQVLSLLEQITEPITDKATAMMWLCRTPKAWEKISDNLKSDLEVMMCYQPTGSVLVYKHRRHLVEGSFLYENAGQCCYVEPEFEELSGILVPTALKENKLFDLEFYREIQGDMFDGASTFIKPILSINETQEERIDFDNLKYRMTKKTFDVGMESSYCAESHLTILNRNKLRELMKIEDPEFEAQQR